jgi:hypothetical protein
MSAQGYGVPKGTELISSPSASEVLAGPFRGTNGTTPFRGVPSVPLVPTSSGSAAPSGSPPRATPQGDQDGEGHNVVPQPLHDLSSPASQSGERDKPAKGAGPVPLSPNSVPRESAAAMRPAARFRDLDEAALFDERAAIREYDGRLPRAAAERLAWVDILAARQVLQATTAILKAS